jgi:hypothetical protein
MANLFAPTGFVPRSAISGSVTSFGQGGGSVSKSDTNALFRGDPLVRLTTGYLSKATPGTTQIHGIFLGCYYISISQGKTIWANYWPGVDAAQDVSVNTWIFPEGAMIVQSGNGGPVTLANVGQNINFGLGAGNTSTQLSGAFADFATIGNSPTLPFRILGLYDNPVGDNGADATTPFNKIIVGFNNQDYNVLTGI